MSCAFSSPSAMTSPRSTVSPSNTLSWRHFGISSSYFSLSSPVMIRRRLPLVSLPKLTVPEVSARMAGSFGLRASNRSATRGRPPVMSRVFEDSCGIRAITSPTDTFAPSSRLTNAPAGSVYTAGISVLANVTTLTLLGIQPHGAGQTGDFVHLCRNRQAVHEVLELQHTGHFGHDRMGVRVPGRNDLSTDHRIAFSRGDRRTVRNLVALALATKLVH